MMQYFWYSSDKRRERFVSICRDPDVQRLTWESYMNKVLAAPRSDGASADLLQGSCSSPEARAAMMMGFFSERGIEIVIAAAAVSVVALVGGLMTDVGPWYESLRFPRLRPPNWLFGPAWTVIFILIAAAGVVAWESAENPATRFRLVALFLINGVLNLLWSPLFFKLRRPDWALYELLLFWLSILVLIVALATISSFAAWLLAPYLAWVTFAGWLNWRVVQLNKPFGSESGKRSFTQGWKRWPRFSLTPGSSTQSSRSSRSKAIVLVLWRALTGGGLPVAETLANLSSGAALLLALRMAITSGPYQRLFWPCCRLRSLLMSPISLADGKQDRCATHEPTRARLLHHRRICSAWSRRSVQSRNFWGEVRRGLLQTWFAKPLDNSTNCLIPA